MLSCREVVHRHIERGGSQPRRNFAGVAWAAPGGSGCGLNGLTPGGSGCGLKLAAWAPVRKRKERAMRLSLSMVVWRYLWMVR